MQIIIKELTIEFTAEDIIKLNGGQPLVFKPVELQPVPAPAPVVEPPAPDPAPVVPAPEPTPQPQPAPEEARPVITKAAARGVRGLTITLDDAPSPEKDALARRHIRRAAEMGFNTVRFLRNEQEAAEDVNRQADPENVCTLTHDLKMKLVFDTVDRVVQAINQKFVPVTAGLHRRTYFANLKALGGAAVYINDADSDELAGTLETMVAQIREATDLPLFGSISASSDLAKYRKLFDHVEIQTFTRKLTEFEGFLKSPAEVLCLDGRRGTAAAFVDQCLDLYRKSGRDSFMVYTSFGGDASWDEQPETVRVYRAFLAAL